MSTLSDHQRPVVAGIDGSPTALHAVRWALLHHAPCPVELKAIVDLSAAKQISAVSASMDYDCNDMAGRQQV